MACPDLAPGFRDHPPGQAGYLLGSQAGFDRQEEDNPVPGGPGGLGKIAQDGIHLPLSECLRLFFPIYPPNPLFMSCRMLDCNKSGEVVHSWSKILVGGSTTWVD